MQKFVIIIFLLLSGTLLWFYWWGMSVTTPISDIQEISYQEILIDDQNDITQQDETISDVSAEDNDVDIHLPQVDDDVENLSDKIENEMKLEVNLAVPFTPQAPFANWELPYQEACEEAAIFMVYSYYQGIESGLIDPTVADDAIWELVNFEEDYQGDALDSTASEVANLVDAFYGMKAAVIDNPTVEQIKEELSVGHPIVVPTAGKKLGNSFYSGDGPLYHMLVLRGYDEDHFITNDSGTRNGDGYVYNIDVIMEAMGDWNDGNPANGAKRVIFILPN